MQLLATSFMRLNSERVPAKLLATVGQLSLAEIMVGKLLALKQQLGDAIEIALAVCPLDEPLIEIAHRLNCPILERSVRSRDGETYQEIYGELRDRLQHKYRRVMWANPCQPFLSVATMVRFIRDELDAPGEFTGARAAVFCARGWVFNHEFQRIIGDHTPNTKYNPPYYTFSSAMFSYPTASLGLPEQMEYRHFFPHAPAPEFLDIDTPEDLEFARCYARGLQSQPLSEKAT